MSTFGWMEWGGILLSIGGVFAGWRLLSLPWLEAFRKVLEADRIHYGLGGLVLGLCMPDAVWQGTVKGMVPVAAFLGFWCGLVAGIDMDLRVMRRQALLPLVLESGYISLFVAFVLLSGYAWGALPPPVGLKLEVAAIMVLCGMCLVERPFYLRGGATQSRGPLGRRNWSLTLGSACGILLVTLGAGQMAGGEWRLAGPLFLGFEGVVIDSVSGRLLGGLAIGGVVGLLIDLATRQDWVRGVSSTVLLAAAMMAGGTAASLGLTPLWIGWVAGAWLLNATLRRLDLLDTIERNHDYVRIGLPVVLGVVVGGTVQQGLFDPGLFFWVFFLLVGVRSGGRWGGLYLIRRILGRRAVRDMRRALGPRLALEDLAVVVALGLYATSDASLGGTVLTAVLAAKIFLSLAVALLKKIDWLRP